MLDLVGRGVEVEVVRGVLAVFCLLDARRAEALAVRSVSDGGGLDSGRAAALRFLDVLGVLEGTAGVGSGSGSGDCIEVSTLCSDSAASLAEERVTLEDMCKNEGRQRLHEVDGTGRKS